MKKCLLTIIFVSFLLPVAAIGSTGPVSLAAGNGVVYIACKDSSQILAYNLNDQKTSLLMEVPQQPCDIIVSADGSKLFVSAGIAEGKVYIINTTTKKISQTFACGYSPAGLALTADGRKLYVCNRFVSSISVFDVRSGKELCKIEVLREPVAAAVTPDGKSLFVTNLIPGEFGDPDYVSSVVSVIDTSTDKVSDSISLPNGSIELRDICFSPDGKWAYVTHILAKYQLPTTQLDRGWINTNALSVIDVENRKLYNTVLLDEVDKGAANPWAVVCSGDGKELYVTHAGTGELSVIDRFALHEKLSRAGKGERVTETTASAKDVANDLAFLVGIRRRVQLKGTGPRGIAVADGKAYVGEYFSNSMSVVDLNDKKVSSISLGSKTPLSAERRGQMLFNDATICFQQWQSCASCHPGDARVDGLNWDLLNDGLGNPKNTKSLLYAHRTPPVMSTGIRKDAETAVRKGINHILYAVIPEEDAAAIDSYLKSLRPLPSPYLVDGKLSISAQKGKKVFEQSRCDSCHSGQLYTDMKLYNVGTGKGFEKDIKFDTPTLIELWRTAPYLHDGRAATLKDILTKFNDENKHGRTLGLNETHLDDLVEFLLSL